jgi:hypothetical protein
MVEQRPRRLGRRVGGGEEEERRRRGGSKSRGLRSARAEAFALGTLQERPWE